VRGREVSCGRVCRPDVVWSGGPKGPAAAGREVSLAHRAGVDWALFRNDSGVECLVLGEEVGGWDFPGGLSRLSKSTVFPRGRLTDKKRKEKR
jgi:hypothetical protein